MGVSTDAILFYGYCWDEEVRLFGDDDWVDTLLRQRGVADPWQALPNYRATMAYHEAEAASKAWMVAHRVEIDVWCAAENAVEDEFGVEVGTHCSDGCAMPYVAIRDVGVLASRGRPQVLTATALAVDPAWDGKLATWFKALGIEPPQERPQWWLASWWG